MSIFDPKVPPHLKEGLDLYLERGYPTGGFLRAVLENNLKEACQRADEYSAAGLVGLVSWLYNRAPMGSWGSPRAVEEWMMEGGLKGMGLKDDE